MSLERLLTVITAAFVCICLGVALLMLAPGAGRDAGQAALAPPQGAKPPVSEAQPAVGPAAVAVKPGDGRKQVEAALASAPEYARFFQRLRELFPADYDAAMDGFAARYASVKAPESVEFYLSEAVRSLRQARGVGAAKADTGPLERVFDMQLEVLRAVAKQDSHLCVSFLYGATDSDFQHFAAGRRALVGDMALAGLDAMANGLAKKIERPAPTEADFKELETALTARGLSKIEIDALLDGKTPDPPIEDARMCATGQIYLETMRKLPEPVRLRIYGLAVELMARS
jgi:hypothetical protein